MKKNQISIDKSEIYHESFGDSQVSKFVTLFANTVIRNFPGLNAFNTFSINSM